MTRKQLTFALASVVFAAVAFFLVAGCGGGGRLNASPDERSSQAGMAMSGDGYNHFVNANLLELFGVYPEALKEYESALEYFSESATIRTDYARLLFRLSKFPEALEQALLIEPKSSEVCLLIGDCYRLTTNIEAAAKYYRRAVELDPENINAYWYLAGYYRQTDQMDSAIAAYYELARLSDTYRIWLELATMLGTSGRYGEALAAFKKAVELNPDVSNINAYLGLATAYDALDSLAQAEQVFNQLVQIAPDDPRVYRQWLDIYVTRENVKKALEISEKLVALVPTDWAAQRRHGILLLSDSQFDRADSLFKSRIESSDDNALNYFYRGMIALQTNRSADAVGFFTEVTLREEAFADGWLNLGYAYSQQDSLGRVVDIYRDGLAHCQSADDSVRMIFALGAALERDGRFYEAVDTFKGLLETDSNNAQALNYLGYMLADRGEQLMYALQLIERALKISPNNGAYIDSYAWVQYKLGNYELALSELKKASDLIDNDAIIFEHLGDVYNALGDKTEAERNYRRALEISPNSIQIEEKLKE